MTDHIVTWQPFVAFVFACVSMFLLGWVSADAWRDR